MRTERPTAQGFDLDDPRLEARRAAAEAQRALAEAPDPDYEPPVDADADRLWALKPVAVGPRDDR